MRKKSILFCILITVAFVSPAFATLVDYKNFDNYGGTWYDANKSWSGDWNLCWAAATSNILTWTGWNDSRPSEYDKFNYYKSHWTDYGSL